MSAAMETPVASDAAQGPTHVPTDADAAGQSGAEVESGPQAGAETAQADKGDYLARVRSDPDFAVEELKKAASDRDRATGKLTTLEKRVGGLSTLLQQDGAGDQVAALAVAANKLLSHPDYAEAVRAAANGQDIPTRAVASSDDDEDEYVDPDVKALREELASVKSTLDQTVRRSSTDKAAQEIESQFGSAFKSYDFTDDEKSQIFSQAESTLGRLSPQQLDAMDGNAWRIFLLAQVDQDTLDGAHERRLLRTQRERANLATDGPSSVAPAQTEKAFSGSSRDVALQALRRVRERQG